MNKRYGNKWSGSVGCGYTMMHDFPNGFRSEPEPAGRRRPHDVELQGVSGSYDAP